MSIDATHPVRAEVTGRLYIDGHWSDGAAGWLDVIDPSTERVVGRAAQASAKDAAAAAAAARAAQPGWENTAPHERAAVLDQISRLIVARSRELVALTMTEGGFTRPMAGHFAEQAAAYFAAAAKATVADHSVPTSPALAIRPDGTQELVNGVIQRRPVGVVACIVPFNGPLFGVSMKAAQALAMGNAVIVKPAPQNPLTVSRLFEIFAEAGLPPGVANLVTSSDPEAGAELTRSRDVDMISFTGSTAVGQQVYAAGARMMKRLVLELGGKGACLVFDDADLDAAARGLANVWRVASGQICSAPTRALVHRAVHDQLMDKLVAISATVKVGSPFAPGTVAGPVISAAQRERIEGFVTSARDEGAEVLAGGARPDFDRGFFVAPTLLAGCHNQMRAVRNEIFGPVISVVPFDTDEEGVAIANDSDYGLAGYVYSRDRARAYAVGSRLRTGIVQLNTVTMKPDMPRGGMKMSGLGREGGSTGLHYFTEMSSVVWS